jgi:hypothetical protein
MKKLILILLLLPVAGFSQSTLAKYQKKIRGSYPINTKAEAAKLVTIKAEVNTLASAYNGPSSADTKRNIYNLSEKGQQALIQALAKNAKDNQALLADIPAVMEPSKPSNADPVTDITEFSKKIEIDVDNLKGPSSSGRIASLVIWITLKNNQDIEFAGFSNLATKYISTDFGTLARAHTSGFTINAGINLGGTGSTTNTMQDVNGGNTTGSTNVNGTSNTSNLGVGYNNSTTLTEQIAIKNNVITMKGSIGKLEASLTQNGVPNQDLNDNINLELLFKTVNNKSEPTLSFKGLYDKTSAGAVTDDSKITLTEGYLTIPQQIDHAVMASLAYTFTYRDIYSGQNTVPESDDKIQYLTLSDRTLVAKDFELLKKDELNREIRHIIAPEDGIVDEHTSKLYLNFRGRNIELLFTNLNALAQLINWLNETKKEKIGTNTFKISQYNKANNTTSIVDYKKEMAEKLRPGLINTILQ